MQVFTLINEFKTTYKKPTTSAPKPPESQQLQTTDGIRKHPPRPLNSFMLYRKALRQKLSTSKLRIHDKEISKLAAALWKGEEEEVRCYYERLAEEEKLRHSRAHPGYKYCPITKRKHKTDSIGSNKQDQVKIAKIATEDPQFNLVTPPTECLDEATINALFGDVDGCMITINSRLEKTPPSQEHQYALN